MTDNELRAVAYFAVGVTSEGSVAGRDESYRLSFAGNVRNGVMDPVGNSGYSFGTLQIDLGQHPDVARQMLDSYQRWAATQPDRAAVELTQTSYDDTLEALQRTGRQMRSAGARDIDRSNINRFLASDQGKAFVHGLDTQHVHGVTAEDAERGNGDAALERLRRTAAYRNASEDDQAQLAGMFMKLQNQAGTGHWPGIMLRVEAGTLTSPDDVKTAIDALLRNQPNPDNPDLGFQYDTVRSLFLSPEASQRFIQALDRGGTLSEGHPQPSNGRPQAGFFVAGHDFVHWNRDGRGVACIGGAWSEIDRSQITRVDRGNGVVDLSITRDGETTPLLRIDPREPALRADLSPASLQLLRDSEHHVRAMADRHNLPWDAGLDNTVLALAAEAREQGLTGITHLKVELGQIRFAQHDGVSIREGQINARAAANTDSAESLAQLAAHDQCATALAQAPAAPQPSEARGQAAPVLSA